MKEYFLDRYAGTPMVAFGFHGCKKSVAQKVINTNEDIIDSNNDYDWLGTGKYFWESNPERAMEWTKSKYRGQKDGPAVIGACIDLTACLNLLDKSNLNKLKIAYEILEIKRKKAGLELPKNTSSQNDDISSNDKLYRKLDCLVINELCNRNEGKKFTTVRGVFWEGNELYPSAGFKEKNHIQICVRDPKAILCHFYPRCFDII